MRPGHLTKKSEKPEIPRSAHSGWAHFKLSGLESCRVERCGMPIVFYWLDVEIRPKWTPPPTCLSTWVGCLIFPDAGTAGRTLRSQLDSSPNTTRDQICRKEPVAVIYYQPTLHSGFFQLPMEQKQFIEENQSHRPGGETVGVVHFGSLFWSSLKNIQPINKSIGVPHLSTRHVSRPFILI